MVDLDKFICSLFNNGYGTISMGDIKEALKQQRLEYKEGAIKPIKKPVNFEEFPREEQLKWYICIKPIPQKDGGLMPLFCEGEHATIEKIFDMLPELKNDTALFTEHFRKVTEVDLPKEKPSTIKFNELDTKKYKFVGLDNPSTPISITRELWRRYSVSHRDSIQEHREELLLSLLTKGYQKYQEEIRHQQSTYYSCTGSFPLSKFEHDVKVLQEDLKHILGVDWNPE